MHETRRGQLVLLTEGTESDYSPCRILVMKTEADLVAMAKDYTYAIGADDKPGHRTYGDGDGFAEYLERAGVATVIEVSEFWFHHDRSAWETF